MRNIVINRLTDIINDCGCVRPYYDCDESLYIDNPADLQKMSDEELVVALETELTFEG